MIAVYFIGGPADLSKRAYPNHTESNIPPELFVLEERREFVGASAGDSVESFAMARRNRYVLRRIARNTYAAIHEEMLGT